MRSKISAAAFLSMCGLLFLAGLALADSSCGGRGHRHHHRHTRLVVPPAPCPDCRACPCTDCRPGCDCGCGPTAAPTIDPPVADTTVTGCLAGLRAEGQGAKLLVREPDGSSQWYEVSPAAPITIDGREVDAAAAIKAYQQLAGRHRRRACDVQVKLTLDAGKVTKVEATTKR